MTSRIRKFDYNAPIMQQTQVAPPVYVQRQVQPPIQYGTYTPQQTIHNDNYASPINKQFTVDDIYNNSSVFEDIILM